MIVVLRWVIGAGCVLALAIFALLMIVGSGIRSAYQSGAGTFDLVRTVLPWLIPLLLIGMLVTAVSPRPRGLMHVVAIGVALAVAGCGVVMMKNFGEGSAYAGFFVLYLIYYWMVVWGGVEPAAH
jgi:hypothetical protein